MRLTRQGKDVPGTDVLVKIRKRDGTRVEGEYWSRNETAGFRFRGTMDGLGNITWRATEVLAGEFPPNLQEALAGGTVRGKQMRVYAYFSGPDNVIAEVNVTRED